jgi:hypothetical protein
MAWRDHLAVHPACEKLPAMMPDALLDLSSDIRANGLQEKIKVIRDGVSYAVLDGRSRLDALEMIGPIQVFDGNTPNGHFFEMIELEGRDPLTFVLSLNVHRRHLTAKQKRDLIAEVLKARPELSDKAIASTTKVSDKTVGAVRRKLEGGAEIPHHQSRVGKDGVQQSVTWPRARKAQPAAPGTGRKHRPPSADTAHDDTEPGLPLVQPQEPKSPEPISLAPEVEPAPSNQPVEVAPPPDPIRLHAANVVGAVAALNRLPDDVDFDRMASIVDPSERSQLRGRVSRGMDILHAMWEALGEVIELPTLAEEDTTPGITGDLSSVEITEKMPPLPG